MTINPTNLQPGAIDVPVAPPLPDTQGGNVTKQLLGSLAGARGYNLDDLIAQATAPATPLENIGKIAGAAGSGASDAQTMAIAQPGAGAEWLNNILTFAKGFAANIDRGMQQPTYADLIASAKAAGKGAAGGKDNADLFLKFKKDFDDTTKNFRLAQEGWNKVAVAARNPSAAGDVAMIFGFMKTIDPGSTVREGEFATVESARGVPAAVIATYNKVLSGERLSNEQREDYAASAYRAYQTYVGQYNNVRKQYEQIVSMYGVDPLALASYEQGAEKPIEANELTKARQTAQPEYNSMIKELQNLLKRPELTDQQRADIQKRIDALSGR